MEIMVDPFIAKTIVRRLRNLQDRYFHDVAQLAKCLTLNEGDGMFLAHFCSKYSGDIFSCICGSQFCIVLFFLFNIVADFDRRRDTVCI